MCQIVFDIILENFGRLINGVGVQIRSGGSLLSSRKKLTLAQWGAVRRKANSHCLMTYFFLLFKICKTGEEGQNWENSKAYTF